MIMLIHAGVTAYVNGRRVLVGRPDWVLSQLPASSSAASTQVPNGTGEKLTEVYVAADEQLLGVLSFKDVLRPDAVHVVSQLQQAGIRYEPVTTQEFSSCVHLAVVECTSSLLISSKTLV